MEIGKCFQETRWSQRSASIQPRSKCPRLVEYSSQHNATRTSAASGLLRRTLNCSSSEGGSLAHVEEPKCCAIEALQHAPLTALQQGWAEPLLFLENNRKFRDQYCPFLNCDLFLDRALYNRLHNVHRSILISCFSFLLLLRLLLPLSGR